MWLKFSFWLKIVAQNLDLLCHACWSFSSLVSRRRRTLAPKQSNLSKERVYQWEAPTEDFSGAEAEAGKNWLHFYFIFMLSVRIKYIIWPLHSVIPSHFKTFNHAVKLWLFRFLFGETTVRYNITDDVFLLSRPETEHRKSRVNQ